MTLRRLATVLLAAALLVAQSSALEHQLRHQASAGVAQDADGGGNPLCDQHAALGDLLGAISCAAVPVAFGTVDFAAVAAPRVAARDNAPLFPSSRDPPRPL